MRFQDPSINRDRRLDEYDPPSMRTRSRTRRADKSSSLRSTVDVPVSDGPSSRMRARAAKRQAKDEDNDKRHIPQKRPVKSDPMKYSCTVSRCMTTCKRTPRGLA